MKNCSAQNARVTWFKGSCRIIPTARFSSPAGKQANRRSRSGPARRRPDCKECRSGPSPVRNADSSSSMLVPGLRPNDIAESGRRGDCSLRLPHHRTCGSASGDSWQSTRTWQHAFSATMIGPVAQPIGFSAPGRDHPWSCSACEVQPFPSCEALRSLRFRLVALGTMASAGSCSRPTIIADRRARRCRRARATGLPE